MVQPVAYPPTPKGEGGAATLSSRVFFIHNFLSEKGTSRQTYRRDPAMITGQSTVGRRDDVPSWPAHSKGRQPASLISHVGWVATALSLPRRGTRALRGASTTKQPALKLVARSKCRFAGDVERARTNSLRMRGRGNRALDHEGVRPRATARAVLVGR
eukprot:2697015-Pleurochrysis_carterae.AAC.1